MFFDDLAQLKSILMRTSCAIVGLPPETELGLDFATILRPTDDKKTPTITVEQIRDLISHTNSRETSERFFIIAPADAMNDAAENAFLKTFEEPKPHCHFVLFTQNPASLLPTILSRAQVFYPKVTNLLDQPPAAQAKIMEYAKRLVAAQPTDLITIATEVARQKTNPREQALKITSTAIELLYKSYFKTGNPKFLTKLPNFINLYDNLNRNGHIKLHLIADLL